MTGGTDGAGSGDAGTNDGAASTEGGVGVVRRNQVASFVAVTLAVSWGWWAFADAVLAGSEGLTRLPIAVGAFGPPLGALVVTWASGNDVRAWLRGLARWRFPVRWYLAALALPIVLAVGGTAVLVATGVPTDLGVLSGRAVLFPLVLAITVFVGGGQEEPGWRGFALPRLQAEYSALTASLAIGVVWAVWHLPLFLLDAPRNATGSFGVYLVTVLAISVVMTSLYNASGGSVLLVAVAHAGVNTSGVLFPLADGTASELGLVLDLAITAPLSILALAAIARHGPATLCPGTRTTTAAAPPDPRDRGGEASSGSIGT